MNETERRKFLEAKHEQDLFEERVTVAIWIALILLVAAMVVAFSTLV